MKSYLILLLFLLSPFIILGQDNRSVSLFDCLKKAREYHPYYLDKQRLEDSRNLRNKNVSTMWLPQLNLNGQATYQSDAIKIDIPFPGMNIKGSPQDQYKVTLDVNQVIYDGGSARAQRKITNATIDADLQQNESDVYKSNEPVTSVYFNLLIMQKNKEVYESTFEDLKSKEGKITSGVKNGILLQSDLDNLKVELIKTKQFLDDIEIAIKNGFDILRMLTGDSLINSSRLLVPEVNFQLNDSINRPEIKIFDLQQKTLEESKYLSVSQKMPKLYAFTQLGYGRPGLNMLKDEFQSYYIVGLKFQWNIWDWNKTQRDKSIYSLQQDMVSSKKDAYVRNININGTNELTRIQQLENTLKTDEEIVTLRKSITIQTEKRLDQGIVTMSDYLSEYNSEVKAGIQFETHKIQLLQSKINYLIIKGIL